MEMLPECIQKMKQASSNFYKEAIHSGNHAFIEFTGLMTEYINICEDNMKAGVNFSEANRHCGTRMRVEPYRIEYLKEKLECIFEGLEKEGTEKITKAVDTAVDAR